MIPQKVCTKCGEEKTSDQFGPSKRSSDGLFSWCRECKRESDRKRRAENPEKHREYGRKKYEKHKERILQYHKNHYEQNKERILERDKEYRERNKEAIKARQRQYYRDDPLRRLKYHLRKRYDLSLDSYLQMLTAQSSGCAICHQTVQETGKLLFVDHDHETGAIRALLCHFCNVGLGVGREDPDLLRRMADYLESHSKNPPT